MTGPVNTLTPAQRLQASRQAIVVHLQRSRRRSASAPAEGMASQDDASTHASDGSGWWGVARHALSAWFRGHPAYSAAMVARPVIEGFAREKPVQVLGIAAAVGAAVVLLKPWRLISVGALVAATLKSGDMSRMVMSMMADVMTPPSPPHKDDPQ